MNYSFLLSFTNETKNTAPPSKKKKKKGTCFLSNKSRHYDCGGEASDIFVHLTRHLLLVRTRIDLNEKEP